MFVQVRDAATNETIASVDVPPLADYPTQEWVLANEIVLSDNIDIPIPDNVTAGAYYVATGFYNTDTQERLEIWDDNGNVVGSETRLDNINIEASCRA